MGSVHSVSAQGSGCPMGHGAPAPAPAPAPAAAAAPPPGCPMHAGDAKKEGAAAGAAAGDKAPASGRARGTVYNVYAQPIDPTNMMPAAPAQQPTPGQRMPLSTQRVQSSIPKGGTESTWLYPSPQMFWNALSRKGKAEGVDETDMDVVVSIHNEMNERAWRLLAEWEDGLHKGQHLEGEPSLRRFMGKPFDLSPKARIKSWFGYGFPFDRHDWFVDRNEKQVRYVIDYYFCNEDGRDVSNVAPGSSKPNYTKSIYVDVRPAVDDVTSFFDRLRMFPTRAMAALQRPKFFAEGLDPAKAPKEAAAFALASPDNATVAHGDSAKPAVTTPAAAPVAAAPVAVPPTARIPAAREEGVFAVMDAKCKPLLERLASASTEDDRRHAHVSLNYCMATVLCPAEAKDFLSILESNNAAGDSATDASQLAEAQSFERMQSCVLKAMTAARAAGQLPKSGTPAPAAAAPLK